MCTWRGSLWGWVAAVPRHGQVTPSEVPMSPEQPKELSLALKLVSCLWDKSRLIGVLA